MKKVLLLLSILSLTGCFGYDIFFRESRVEDVLSICHLIATIASIDDQYQWLISLRQYVNQRQSVEKCVKKMRLSNEIK
jgi:hypothetical protein